MVLLTLIKYSLSHCEICSCLTLKNASSKPTACQAVQELKRNVFISLLKLAISWSEVSFNYPQKGSRGRYCGLCYVVHRGWAKEEGASCYSRDDSPYHSAPLVCHYLSENATEMPLWILSHSSLLAAKHAGKLAF